jgi:chromosome segregation ATPase
MNIPTPRTNAAASESIVKVYETSLQLETELTTALAEIDRLDVAGIHSCHANCQKSMCVMRRELTSATEQQNELKEENKHLKDQLATLSKTHATDMQRLSDMIDERQEALRYISEIIEEKSAEREDLELGSTAYKTVRRWASFFLELNKVKWERDLLAMLASDTPQFFNPLHAARAVELRDKILQEND